LTFSANVEFRARLVRRVHRSVERRRNWSLGYPDGEVAVGGVETKKS
jgi:hypothetical protein